MSKREALLNLPGVADAMLNRRFGGANFDQTAAVMKVATDWSLKGDASKASLDEVRAAFGGGAAGEDAVRQILAVQKQTGHPETRVALAASIAANGDPHLTREFLSLNSSFADIDIKDRVAAKAEKRDGPAEKTSADPYLAQHASDQQHLRDSLRTATAWHAPSMLAPDDVKFAAKAVQRASRGEDAFAGENDLRADVAAAFTAHVVTGVADQRAGDDDAVQSAIDAGYQP
jgi:hypothetical protein